MRLRDDESDLFYEAWLPLLTFVHEQTGLAPELRGRRPNDPLSSQQAATLRDRLWQDDSLRRAFVTKNPYGLRDECLVLVRSWEHRVSDTFVLINFDREGRGIFLAKDQAYAVLGLKSELFDIVPEDALPRMLVTTLLPFGDRIITDGLMSVYNVLIGPNMRGNYRREYQAFKARKVIRTRLPIEAPTSAQPSVAQLDRMIARLLGPQSSDRACEVAFRDQIRQHVRLPFQARMHGEPCRVVDIVLPTRGGLKVEVRVDSKPSRWPLQDLSLVDPWPEGAEWIAAYQHWKESMATPSPRPRASSLSRASRGPRDAPAAEPLAPDVVPAPETPPAPPRPTSSNKRAGAPGSEKKPAGKAARPSAKKWTWRF